MENATIGDDVSALYEFDWGDLAEAGFDATMDDIVDVARDDPECEVRIIGFEQGA